MEPQLPPRRGMPTRWAIPLLALSAIAPACSAEHTAAPETTTSSTAVLEYRDPTSFIDDSCEVDNPHLAPFKPDNPILQSIREKGIANHSHFKAMSDEEIESVHETFEKEYGLNVTFPETAIRHGGFVFGTIYDNPDSVKFVKSVAFTELAFALTMFTPQLTKALELKELVFVNGMTKRINVNHEVSTTGAAGMVIVGDDAVYIDVSAVKEDSTRRGVITDQIIKHELSHAIDYKLLCAPDSKDIYSDEAFTQFNTHQYGDYPLETSFLADRFIKPCPDREFVATLGLDNANEDRATIVEWSLDGRLILPGDPDWDSPLRHKQEVVMHRLETLMPGITAYLRQRTIDWRRDPYNNFELNQNLQNMYMPNQFMRVEDIVEVVAKNGWRAEVVPDSLLVVYGMPVQNPILLRGPDGKINQVVWGYSENHPEQSFDTHMFDPTWMKLYSKDDHPQTAYGSIVYDKLFDPAYGFHPSQLSVNGLTAAYSEPESLDVNMVDYTKKLVAQYPYTVNVSHL